MELKNRSSTKQHQMLCFRLFSNTDRQIHIANIIQKWIEIIKLWNNTSLTSYINGSILWQPHYRPYSLLYVKGLTHIHGKYKCSLKFL